MARLDDARDNTGKAIVGEMSIARFEWLDEYGDAYEALHVCQTLEMVISRLRQKRLLDDQEWSKTSANIAEIRERLQGHLAEP